MKKEENEINIKKKEEIEKVKKEKSVNKVEKKEVKEKNINNKKIDIKKEKKVNKETEIKNKQKKKKEKISLKEIIINFDMLLLTKKFEYLIAIIGGIVSLIVVIYLIMCINMSIKYSDYTRQMEVLGFSDLYDNGKATAYEQVTYGEAIKLILASIYNTDRIDDFAYEPEYEEKNSIWVTYAKQEGIIDDLEITINNTNRGAKYIDVLKYYTKAREILLQKYLDITDIELKFNGIKTLPLDKQTYIAEAIKANMLENTNETFKANGKIIKGEMSKLVVNFVKTFNTINISENEIETNKTNFPKNYKEYPYIVKNIEKDIYELPFYIDSANSYTPSELYKYRKEYYEQAMERLNNYYNTILNVDYNTITFDSFKKAVNEKLQYVNKDKDYEEYVQYVKDNKLIIKGKITPLIPIIYVDGTHYRVRSKVEIEIVSGNTQKSVILGDLKVTDGVTYQNKKTTFYADIPMETSLTSYSMYPITAPLVHSISGDVNNVLLNII